MNQAKKDKLRAFKDKVKIAKSGEICVTVKAHKRTINGREYDIPEHERCVGSDDKGVLKKGIAKITEKGKESITDGEFKKLLAAFEKENKEKINESIVEIAESELRNSTEFIIGENGISTPDEIQAKLVDDINLLMAASGAKVNPISDNKRFEINHDAFKRDGLENGKGGVQYFGKRVHSTDDLSWGSWEGSILDRDKYLEGIRDAKREFNKGKLTKFDGIPDGAFSHYESLVSNGTEAEFNNLKKVMDADADSLADAKVTFSDSKISKRSLPKKIKIEDYYGKPMVFTISDQMGTGDLTDPMTGKKIDGLHGGILFNSSEIHSGFAWASIGRTQALNSFRDALDVYKLSPEDFKDGYVPLGVVKMGQGSIDSNEAMYRTLGDRIDLLLTKEEKQATWEYFNDKIATKKISSSATKFLNEVREQDDPLGYMLHNIVQIPAGNRKPFGDILMIGSSIDTAPSKYSHSSSSILSVLDKDGDSSKFEIFNRASLNGAINEDAISNIPARHIIAVHEVQVLELDEQGKPKKDSNGNFILIPEENGVIETNHRNYPYGTIGRAGGILDKSAHLTSVLPVAIANQYFHATRPEVTSRGALVSQAVSTTTLPAQKSFVGKELTGELDEAAVFDAYFALSFPRVDIVRNRDHWDELVSHEDFKEEDYDGRVDYGFLEKDGKVFLNPDIMQNKTPVRAMGHMWIDYIENSNSDLYDKGMDMISETKFYSISKKKFKGSGLKGVTLEKRIREEALADAIGAKTGLLKRLSEGVAVDNWLSAFSTTTRELFPNQFSNTKDWKDGEVTIQDFLFGAIGDLFKGQSVSEKKVKNIRTRLTDEEREKLLNRLKKYL